ncbi:hypothetical protein D3C87_77780 [compost metagenome]
MNINIDYDKVRRYTIASLCGIIGFAATYALLGLITHPIQEWIDYKFEKGLK